MRVMYPKCGIHLRTHQQRGFVVAEFIYTMKNVRRAIGEKVILDNVTMAFYPGAKTVSYTHLTLPTKRIV